jgi:hypothetical protein
MYVHKAVMTQWLWSKVVVLVFWKIIFRCNWILLCFNSFALHVYSIFQCRFIIYCDIMRNWIHHSISCLVAMGARAASRRSRNQTTGCVKMAEFDAGWTGVCWSVEAVSADCVAVVRWTVQCVSAYIVKTTLMGGKQENEADCVSYIVRNVCAKFVN